MMGIIDILNRNEDIERLLTIIETISKNKANTTFAINGGWGSGKSFVLNMLEESLEKIQNEATASNRYIVFHYDSWKYDYYDEPILAIVASMTDTLDEKTSILSEDKKEYIKKAITSIGNVFLNIANKVVEAKTGLSFIETVEAVKKSRCLAKNSIKENHNYDAYFSFNKTLEIFRKTILDISATYTVVFVVDELDRCLPSYAIKVLERLHHITNGVSNTATIIATDKQRLESIIQTTIGDVNVNDYLKKFIHFELSLDIGKTNNDIVNRFSSYFTSFEGDHQDEAIEYVHAILSNKDIRSISRLISSTEMIHNILSLEKKDYSVMCMELLVMALLNWYKYDFNSDSEEINVSNSNFISTKPCNGELMPELMGFISEKAKQIKNRWKETSDFSDDRYYWLDIDHDTTLYEKLCYYYCHLVNGNNINITGVINDEKKIIEENSEYIKSFCEFAKLIH